MDIWLIAYSDRHLQLFGTVLAGLEVGTRHILYLLCAMLLWLLPQALLSLVPILQNSSLVRIERCRRKPGWMGPRAIPSQLEKHRNMEGAAFQFTSSTRPLRSCVVNFPRDVLREDR